MILPALIETVQLNSGGRSSNVPNRIDDADVKICTWRITVLPPECCVYDGTKDLDAGTLVRVGCQQLAIMS